MAFNFFRRNAQKSFEQFFYGVLSQQKQVLDGLSNDFLCLYKSNNLLSPDNAKTVVPEMMQFLTYIMYLAIQQHWQPFGENEAKVVRNYIQDQSMYLRENIPSKYNISNVIDRINDYDLATRHKIQHYGQSLYLVLDDPKLDELKSDAYGRCMVLFSDFLFFSRELKDFAGLKDIAHVFLTGLDQSLVNGAISVQTIEFASKAIKRMQETISLAK